MLDWGEQRARMVENQIVRRGVSDPRVLDALRRVARERFVPETLAEFAHEDRPLSIEAGQTISQPYIVARMMEAAAIAPGDRVLEIGTGSGYAAAVISRIARASIRLNAMLTWRAPHNPGWLTWATGMSTCAWTMERGDGPKPHRSMLLSSLRAYPKYPGLSVIS